MLYIKIIFIIIIFKSILLRLKDYLLFYFYRIRWKKYGRSYYWELFLSKKRHINDNGSVGYLNLKSTYFSTKILRPKFREFCKFSIILSRLNNFPPGLIDPRYFIIIERLEDKNNWRSLKKIRKIIKKLLKKYKNPHIPPVWLKFKKTDYSGFLSQLLHNSGIYLIRILILFKIIIRDFKKFNFKFQNFFKKILIKKKVLFNIFSLFFIKKKKLTTYFDFKKELKILIEEEKKERKKKKNNKPIMEQHPQSSAELAPDPVAL